MKNGLVISFFLQLALAGTAAFGVAQETLHLEQIGVEDGDTLILTIDGRLDERLQLAHIDAPEDLDNAKLQHDIKRTGLDREVLLELGRAATSHLRGLAADDAGPFVLTYDPGQRDRYGRLVGEVSDADGRSLGAAMVEDGFARVLPPRPPASPVPTMLTESEADAISSNRGLWGTHREASRAWRGPRPNNPKRD